MQNTLRGRLRTKQRVPHGMSGAPDPWSKRWAAQAAPAAQQTLLRMVRALSFCAGDRTFLKFLKKVLAFFRQLHYTMQVRFFGWLVKRLRRRPLTAKTGVRFPYQLLFENCRNFSKNTCNFQINVLYWTRFVSNLWLIGQAVKTSPSHGENRGSIPLSAAYSLIE